MQSQNTEVQVSLKKANILGINYRNAIPDFTPVVSETVKIKNMSDNRRLNFREADEILAKKLSVSRVEIVKMRKELNLTWHELNDMKSMQLLPSQINNTFGHLGGVSESKRYYREE